MMLKHIFLGLLLSPCVIFFAGQDDHANFMRGNNFFLTNNYELACQAYQKIDNKGFAVFYNLGLSYLHQEKLPQAIIYCKRAEKLANFKELTQLYEIFNYMRREIDPDYIPGWYDQFAIFLKKCILSIPMLFLQLLLLVITIVFIVCWYRRWYKVTTKVLVGLGLCYTLLGGVYQYKVCFIKQQIGIVTKKLVYLLTGPDSSFYKKSELHEADEVIIIGVQPEYYQVRAKQTIGWIHHDDIEVI